MGLYLDDDCCHGKLVEYLRDRDIEVAVPSDYDFRGKPDIRHFGKSMEEGLRLVTSNRDDFRKLLDDEPTHPGVYVWNQENIVSKDLDWLGVGEILAEFESSAELRDHFGDPPILDLSMYRYLLEQDEATQEVDQTVDEQCE